MLCIRFLYILLPGFDLFMFLKDLDGRYNAMLQMYGEKVEEVDELRLDLQDVKDMYKGQVKYFSCILVDFAAALDFM